MAFSPKKREFQYGGSLLVIETGEIAKQASGSVMVSLGDTVVLVTVVAEREGSGRDFFPLTVDYQEKTYAAGRIPGGFFRREGRPGEKEILTCRLIDRPMRPLFPKGYNNEVQIMATVLSVDPDIDPDIPALIGASAAVSIAGIPFAGPIGAARVGYADGEYILNPTLSQLVDSDLDLVVAGTEAAVLMVESEANALSEEVMLGAVLHGHQQMQPVISAINDLSAEIGNPKWEYSVSEENPELASRVESECGDAVRQAFSIAEKMSRQDALAEVRSVAHERLGGETDSEGERRWSTAAA